MQTGFEGHIYSIRLYLCNCFHNGSPLIFHHDQIYATIVRRKTKIKKCNNLKGALPDMCDVWGGGGGCNPLAIPLYKLDLYTLSHFRRDLSHKPHQAGFLMFLRCVE